jgi:hypothetical protein
MAVWQPQDAAVMQLCHLLNEYQNPASNHSHVRLVSHGAENALVLSARNL